MKFGEMALKAAGGSLLAHSVGGLKKGRRLTPEDIAHLAAQNIARVTVARLGPQDVPEDEAAAAIAKAICGPHVKAQAPFTGRANLHAAQPGLAIVNEALLARVNRVHEAITIATLRSHERVAARQMLATVKIIPFAAPKAALAKVLGLLRSAKLVQVAPFKAHRAGLVITQTPATKPGLVAKSEAAIRDRLAALGSELARVIVVPHDAAATAGALRELRAEGLSSILVFGATAIVDRKDVIPTALAKAGGRLIHLGMPVDPGNLLMLGRLGKTPVVGVPTCARSPKTNGFDWILNRLCAGLKVAREDVMAMGAGGLLAEIATRPQPREGRAASPLKPHVAAIVLAAGKSSRMGEGANKLLADLHGRPLLAQTLARITASDVDEVIVVTGNMERQGAAIAHAAGAKTVHNPNYEMGLASSLRTGLAAAAGADAALICLGDMPLVRPDDINRQIAAFNVADGREIVVPVRGRKLGNPVLWGRRHFAGLMALEGDRGAKGLLEHLRDEVTEIEVAHDGIFQDADTPEALAALRAVHPSP